jgi:hypothetical protein
LRGGYSSPKPIHSAYILHGLVELVDPAWNFDKFLPKHRGTYFIESWITEFEDIVEGFHE